MTQESNKPLTARSVMASALLGMDPPELPVAQLVRLTGLFGISANRARVALSRMVATGEATTDGAGRYRLSGHLADRQSRQSASRSGRTGAFSGDWVMAVVTTSGRSAELRTARRRALAYARLAEWREGVWLRPANLEVVVPTAPSADLELVTARPGDPVALAGAAVGPARLGRHGAGCGSRMARWHRTARCSWRPGSSSPPPCCRHLQGTRCCRPPCCRPTGPGCAAG